MQFKSVVLASVLAASAEARKCYNATVPVTISARNVAFNLPQPSTNLDVTTFIQNFTQQGNNFTAQVATGFTTISKTYNISTQYCTPDTPSKNQAIQVLTHGIGFDKTYWDLSFANYNYSYINSAIGAGYSTLSYDRLGIGNSSHGDPVNEIQAFLEVQALRALTEQLRNGTFPSAKGTKFTKVVHVGHSFGSVQTYALVANYPELSDGIALTGYTLNGSFLPYFAAGAGYQIASTNQPLRFGNVNASMVQEILEMSPVADLVTGLDLSSIPKGQNLPNGYLVSNNAQNGQYLFLKPPYFNPRIGVVAEMTKQPVTYGELLTIGTVQPMVNNFAKPVLVITGQYDLPFCGGDCLATGGAAPNLVTPVSKAFPKLSASNFSGVIQPRAGHGINAHYNATGAYAVINNFFASKGIKSS